jgi:Uri superfamily endonuclease
MHYGLLKQRTGGSELRGLYALLLGVDREIVVAAGSIGRVKLRPGIYVYIGSGLGVASTSIEGRLARHFNGFKRKHWHIDHLLSSSRCKPLLAIISEARRRLECDLAAKILEDHRASLAHRGFGSSDCSCGGHLISLKGLGRSAVERLVRERFKDLQLKPQRWCR